MIMKQKVAYIITYYVYHDKIKKHDYEAESSQLLYLLQYPVLITPTITRVSDIKDDNVD